HILNPLWHSHDVRRKRRRDAIVEANMWYLRQYDAIVKNIKAKSLYPLSECDTDQEHVFSLWLQGEQQAPPIVKACFESMRVHINLPLVVLDEKTIFDWISLPDHIMDKWRKGRITRTHFSDICRVELLYEHGGIWADATDFFTSPIPSYVTDEDFFVFMAGSNIRLGGTHAFVQSCFMRMRKGNPLLGMWRELLFKYWEKENQLLDYFTLHFLFRYLVENNEEAAKLFSSMPKINQDPTHVLFCEYKDAPYSPQLYEEITGKTFFQKTTYKDKSAQHPKSGSIAEYIISKQN
ncbi:MAG: capsular polysaccharide synthesis protein, partial [Muribaculaceae bacterium]|nr:capsular polysaccharide synthesis protein [Muribaculaceae bacterium]